MRTGANLRAPLAPVFQRRLTTVRLVEAVVWSDYLCPWCYVGRDRTAAIEDLGVQVTPLPYELHPEIPPEGRRAARSRRESHGLVRERLGRRVRKRRDRHRRGWASKREATEDSGYWSERFDA